ncbi:MAG: hypothetical protein K6F35_09715 [Lachnospiraceae bacterium]|nr:hypothetical protein [Lachnospiraceae bacterium]
MCDTSMMNTNKAMTPAEVTKKQEEKALNSLYSVPKMDEMTYQQQTGQLSDTRHNYLRNHVRSAIIDNLGRDRYAAFDELMIKKAGQSDAENVDLHHSTGSRYALNGEDVIEFDIAGSGFRYPRMEHKELTAWESKDEYRDKEIETNWYNEIKPFTWLPKVKTKKQINELNENREKTNKKIEAAYGRQVQEKVNGKKLGHLMKKEAVNDKDATKTRFYLKGPNAINVGKYSEDNLEEYIFELGKSSLETKLNDWDWLDDEQLAQVKPVNIMVYGHSRGGVACVLGAMRLKRWIADKHPALLHKIHFEVIQYDPVAGGPENFGNNAKIDHIPEDAKQAKKGSKYMSLGEEANTTVVYSLHTDHDNLFTPQRVDHPKRIILSMSDHAVNLNQVDKSQDGDATRITYLAEKNGKVEAFRSSGLGDLDEGVFIIDDQNNLIKLRSLEEYDALAKSLLKGAQGQDDRHNVIRASVQSWFKKNGEARTEAEIEVAKKKDLEKKAPKATEAPKPKIQVREKTDFDRMLETLETPKELKEAVKEKDKLNRIDRGKTKLKDYQKKQKKYFNTRRSGMKAYVDRLVKQKGSYINRTRKEYIYDIIELAYQLDVYNNGFAEADRKKKIQKLEEKIRNHPSNMDYDRFVPAYLRKELKPVLDEYVGEGSIRYMKDEAPEYTIIQEEPVQKEEVKQEEPVQKEGEKKEKVKQAPLPKLDEIPFTEHKASMTQKGMARAYERQPVGSNNCFCCAGTALMNQFIAKRKGADAQVGTDFRQDMMRSYRPDVQKFDPNNPYGVSEEEYESYVREMDSYAGKGKMAAGNLFEMGDFLLDKLAEKGIDHVMLNKVVMNQPSADQEDDADEVKERNRVMHDNIKAAFADRIHEIISSGSIAGIYIGKGAQGHYVTITGIDGRNLEVYNSSGYQNKPVQMSIDDLLVRGESLEINWLSEIKEPQDMIKEFPNLEHTEENGYDLKEKDYSSYMNSLFHTKGVTVAKNLTGPGLEGFAHFAYIRKDKMQADKVTLDEAMATAQEIRTKIQRQEAEQKAKEAEGLKSREELETGEKQKTEEKQETTEKQKTSEEAAAEEKQKDPEGTEWDSKITQLFYNICGQIRDEYYDRSKGKVVEDEVWSRIRVRENDDSIAYKQFRDAVEKVKKLAERLGPNGIEGLRPTAETVMAAMNRLSETATVFYDTHRGHQYFQRGKDRRKACDLVREMTREFYSRMDVAMGGKGIEGLALKKDPGTHTKKEKEAANKTVDELVKVYGKWKKHFALQEGLDQAKAKSRLKLFAPYMRALNIYRDTHSVKDWPKEVEELIRESSYLEVQNRVMTNYEEQKKNFADPLTKLANAHVDMMNGNKVAEKQLSPKEMDAKLSPEQLKAIDAVDRWFLRNYNNGGIVGSMLNIKNHNGEMVSRLFAKTKRERLFLYYLIETKKRKAPGIYDVFESQSFVPSLDAFKSQMLATRFKLMSHIMGGYVYMGKVTEASQATRDFQNLLAGCAKMDQGQKEVKGKELEELKKNKEEYRTYVLLETQKTTKAFRDDAIRVRDLGKKATEKDKASLEEKKKAFLRNLEELIKADDAVGEAIQFGQSLGKVETGKEGKKDYKPTDKYYSVKNTNAVDFNDNAGVYASAGSAITSNVHFGVNGAVFVGNAVKTVATELANKQYNPTHWKLKSSTVMNPNTYAATISAQSINALGSLIGALYGIYNLKVNWDNMHAMDRAASVADILASTTTMATTVMTTIDTAKDLSEGLEPVTSTLTKTLGATAAGLKAGKDIYTTISGHYDMKNAKKASKLLSEKIGTKYIEQLKIVSESDEQKAQREAGETKEQKEKREQEFRKVQHEHNMLKLSDRISGRKRKFAGIQSVSSSLVVAGLFLPGVGVIGLGMGVVTSILAGVSLTGIRTAMFDEYFDFQNFMKKAKESMRANGQRIYNEKEFEERMRREVCAAAGFADLVSACDQISKKYADQIINGLFGPPEAQVGGEVREAYIQLIKSYGLPYNEEKKIPSPELLARRMNGK